MTVTARNQPGEGRAPRPDLSSGASSGAEGLPLIWQCVIFLLVLGAIITRRPDMFLNPQFYAEDGKYWYAQAYNLGWAHSLLLPLGGYLNTLPRLVAGITLLLPFKFAPLIMNTAGLLIQALPVTILLSARCRRWGSIRQRMLMAAVYVAIPCAWEVHVVLTNAQWNLALAELLLAFAAAPRTWVGRSSDILIFLVGAVSGPFPLLIVPLLLYFWWRRREAWSLVILAMLSIGTIIQLSNIILIGRPRIGELGATPILFLRMLAGDIFIDALLGPHAFATHWPAAPLVVTAVLGVIFTTYVCWRANLELCLIAIFAVALLGSALHAPFIVTDGKPLWQLLVAVPGARYWYFPTLTFLWAIVWCVFQRDSPNVRVCGSILLASMLLGVFMGWRYWPFDDHHFSLYAQQFDQAQPGQQLVIPIPPLQYTMELTKH